MTSPSLVLEFLCKVEKARAKGRGKAMECLLPAPAPAVAKILAHEEVIFGRASLCALLKNLTHIVRNHVVARNVSDWPFEYFWPINPSEPRHSKMLGYFIDPEQDHKCGVFLLHQLFAVIAHDKDLPVEGCRVRVEKRDENGQMDIAIRRELDGRKEFAVVIENKINGAPDQPDQLQRYVAQFKGEGFPYEAIHVFYLPLTKAKDPNPEDERIIRGYRVNYKKITFWKDILGWLDVVLDSESEGQCPEGMHDMRDNLSHYRNLIRYLVNEQKELEMKTEILKQLQQAEADDSLPAWTDIETVKQSAESLQQCFESMLRGKLLMAILQRFPPESMWLCFDSDHACKVAVSTPYDQCFLENMNVCLRADDSVAVCFGAGPGSPTNVWLGYMRTGSQEGDKAIEDIVFQEATSREQHECEDGWYKFQPWEEKYCDRYIENLAPTVIGWLIDMRDTLQNRLKDYRTSPKASLDQSSTT